MDGPSSILEIFRGLPAAFERVEKAKSYCDFIADACARAMRQAMAGGEILSGVGKVQSDLTAGGALRSYRKVIEVEDYNGNRYRVTVEDVRDLAREA